MIVYLAQNRHEGHDLEKCSAYDVSFCYFSDMHVNR